MQNHPGSVVAVVTALIGALAIVVVALINNGFFSPGSRDSGSSTVEVLPAQTSPPGRSAPEGPSNGAAEASSDAEAATLSQAPSPTALQPSDCAQAVRIVGDFSGESKNVTSLAEGALYMQITFDEARCQVRATFEWSEGLAGEAELMGSAEGNKSRLTGDLDYAGETWDIAVSLTTIDNDNIDGEYA